jgi:hypothetical protein
MRKIRYRLSLLLLALKPNCGSDNDIRDFISAHTLLSGYKHKTAITHDYFYEMRKVLVRNYKRAGNPGERKQMKHQLIEADRRYIQLWALSVLSKLHLS